jgi:spore coat protein U-like protein
MMNKTRVQCAVATALALVAFGTPAAFGQTVPATSTMAASANVTANCTVNTTTLQFSDTDVTNGLAHDGSGTLNVLCTNGTTWTASADQGAGGTGASMALRQMTFGTNKLNYILYNDDAKTAIWGDGTTGTSTITHVGSGVSQPYTLTGTIPAGQTALPMGLYTDTVNVTVTY